jgi:hypothetical protein
MKDFAHRNQLIVGEENDDAALLVYLEMAIDDFNNATTPSTNYTLDNFPSYSVLVWGTVIQALMGESLLQIRNRLNYSDGGLTIATSDKAGDYAAAMQQLAVVYEQKKRDVKTQINVDMGYGNVPSEYATVDFFY